MNQVFVQVMGAEDDLAHLVAFRLYEEALITGAGRYPAVCGKSVLVAAMSEAPGRRCPLCRAAGTTAADRDRGAVQVRALHGN